MKNSKKPKIPPLQKPARVWDMFDPNVGRVPDEVKGERLGICQTCPFFMKITHQCRKCGCIMDAKASLPHASCPEGKWDVYIEETDNVRGTDPTN
jgi:hypothetical protein